MYTTCTTPLQTARVHVLDTESFEDTFGPKAQRKRPHLSVSSVEVMIIIIMDYIISNNYYQGIVEHTRTSAGQEYNDNAYVYACVYACMCVDQYDSEKDKDLVSKELEYK